MANAARCMWGFFGLFLLTWLLEGLLIGEAPGPFMYMCVGTLILSATIAHLLTLGARGKPGPHSCPHLATPQPSPASRQSAQACASRTSSWSSILPATSSRDYSAQPSRNKRSENSDPSRCNTHLSGVTPLSDKPNHSQGLNHTRGTTPVTWRCTRYVAVHPNRRGVMPTDRMHCLLEQVKVWSVCAGVTVSHSGEDCFITVACGLVDMIDLAKAQLTLVTLACGLVCRG